jgi:hypothetical protein
MSLTNSFETSTLTYLFTTGTPSPVRPTAWYLGLFTAAPGEAGGGTEISGSAYARQAITFTVSGDTASNNAALEFPTATGSWGTVTHVAVFDALTTGNMIAYATLTASKVIDTGDVLRVPSGDLDITLT